jgi:hypothetical protein
VPLLVCPHCQHAAPVEDWPHDPPHQKIPFRRTCPGCGQSIDVADLRQRAPWTRNEAE